MRKRVVILGSTGSIGTQTLDVIAQHPDELEVVGLAAGSRAEALLAQAQQFGVKRLALFQGDVPGIPTGMEAILDLVRAPDVDLVVVAVAGVIGLEPTLEAIRHGRAIALASKEVLVAAGAIVMPMVAAAGVSLTPIDSEHSALFQCLQGYSIDQVSRLILTASGGPFRGRTRAELTGISVEQALSHPTWRMGGKITIDSATLMNKGLEIIEAMWLFGVPADRIDVVVHPQSIIHSLVEFRDTSVLGQFGWPDMRIPIQYALLYPARQPNALRPWNPVLTPNLTFEAPDETTFPALGLARRAIQMGGTAPCALNAANEEAANSFLRGEIGFLEITEIVQRTLDRHRPEDPTLENLRATDRQVRENARTVLQGC
ncbi:MAG: 1-deoxy-D-xylulose-5-phosphate reductoisomerase [Fimbriimonadaceae bacterium]|nr:1-deoxy-D-xylulose-5-phosphate reductoisomerase [Fimbriimonadaceae bacterium]